MNIKIFSAAILFCVSSACYACSDDDDAASNHHKNEHHQAKSTKYRDGDEHNVTINETSDTLKGDVSLLVNGMMCTSCKDKLEAAVQKLPEVASVTANIKTKIMTVKLKSPISKMTLAQAIKNAGFTPQ